MNAEAATVARNAAKSIARQAKEAALATRTHIQLRDLPRTCLPSDIRRMLAANRVENVTDVAIDYHRFSPAGRAFVTLSDPIHMHPALGALRGATVGSIPFNFRPSPLPDVPAPPPRTRGVKGREQARERGLTLTGNGPRGGVSGAGKNVVLYGLPGKLSHNRVRDHLRGFSFAPGESERTQVEKVLGTDGGNQFAFTSRFLVRLASEAEAHRLVRQMHLTYFDEEFNGKSYLVRARVIN